MPTDKELLAKYEAEQLQKTQDSTKSALDELRRTRKQRGGVGEPLQVPAHLKEAAEGRPNIIVTDADLKRDSNEPMIKE